MNWTQPTILGSGGTRPAVFEFGEKFIFGYWNSEGLFTQKENGAAKQAAPKNSFYPHFLSPLEFVYEQKDATLGYKVIFSRNGAVTPVSVEPYAELPRIVSSNSGLHVVYQSTQNADVSIIYAHSTDGVNWIRTPIGSGYAPRIAMRGEEIHIVHAAPAPEYGIVYRYFTDKWHKVEIASGAKEQTPDIAILDQDIAITWADYVGFKTHLKINDKLIPHATINLTYALHPSICWDGKGRLLLTFQGKATTHWDIYARPFVDGAGHGQSIVVRHPDQEQSPMIAAGSTRAAIVFEDGTNTLFSICEFK